MNHQFLGEMAGNFMTETDETAASSPIAQGISFKIRLPPDDWDPSRNAWPCSALVVPTAELGAVFVDGKTVGLAASPQPK